MGIYRGTKLVAGAGSAPSIDATTKKWIVAGKLTNVKAEGDQITIDSEGYVNRNGSRTEHKLVQSFNDLPGRPPMSSDGKITYQSDVLKSQSRNITLSTSEPTARDGQNGDIWIVYKE